MHDNIKIPAIGVMVNTKEQVEELLKKDQVVMIVCHYDKELLLNVAQNITLRNNLFLMVIFNEIPLDIEVITDTKIKQIDMAMLTGVRDIEISSKVYKYIDGIARTIGTFNVSPLQISLLIEQTEIYPSISILEVHPHVNQLFAQNYLQDINISLGAYKLFTDIGELSQIDVIAKKHNTTNKNILCKWLHQRQIFNIIDYVDDFECIDLETIKLKMDEMNKINNLSTGLKKYYDPEKI